jgi:uncharacterized protein (TIGR03437 family)
LGFAISAAADNITTIAGAGTDGFSGDGGSSLAAQFGAVWGLAVGAQGNVYFTDPWNQRVRMAAANGTVSTIAGSGNAGEGGDGGPAPAADLFWPSGLALDSAGNLYVSTGSRVRTISGNGTIAAFAGTPTPGFAGDGQLATAAALREPHGLAVDSAGNVYIADSGNFRIRKVDGNGKITTIAGVGQYGYTGDGGPATAAHIGYVHGLAFDPSGNLYFSDPYNHCVRRISSSGTIQTVAGGAFGSGGDGGAPASAQLKYPQGLVVDRNGDLFVADSLNFKVRVVGNGGTLFTAAGTGSAAFGGDGGPGPYASLNMPYALAVDSAGDLYIADLRNFRIRCLQSPQVPPQPAPNRGTSAIVNSASFAGPAAPGALVSIFGENLARGATAATAVPLPASLGGATVTINGSPAPLLYASSGQINFQMPLVGPGAASMSVARDGITSDPVSIVVAASVPGIFAWDGNQGVILNQDGTLNAPGNPAQPGAPVTIWGTGPGNVKPSVPAGQAASAMPLSKTTGTPAVSIGGVSAQVLFSGLAPGFVGLWQINAEVPENATAGDNIPVQVTINGAASNTVTMAVAQ